MPNDYKSVSKPTKPQQAKKPELSRYAWVGPVENCEGVSWAGIDGTLLATVVAAVAASGDAIRFSLTSGGFALSMAVYSGDNVNRWVTASYEDMSVILERILMVAVDKEEKGG